MYRCLATIFIIINTTSAYGDEYKLSDGWSLRGQHYSIPDHQKNKCKDILTNVLPLIELKTPVHCGLLNKINIPTESKIAWIKPPLQKAAYIKALMFKEKITEKGLNKEIDRMKKEYRVIEVATIPFYKQLALTTPNNEYKKVTEATLIKFSLRSCNKKTKFSSIKHKPIVYFGIAFKKDLTDIQIIKGGTKEEAFLWEDNLYFASISSRVYDDTYQRVFFPDQPVIYIQYIYQGREGKSIISVRQCRLLYWKKGQEVIE